MSPSKRVADTCNDNLAPYQGRWIARVGKRIVGQGGTPRQALQAAKTARYKEISEIMYIPTTTPFKFPPLVQRVRAALPADLVVYLVGGAVRDALLSQPIHDLDFALPDDALSAARRVADHLGAAYFPLDVERRTARLIYTDEKGTRHILDFATLRGPDLQADLRGRDFTINAIAVDIRSPLALLDPLGGASDLQSKTLRSCSASSFRSDPVRILRAIRMAAGLDLRITADTRTQMRAAVSDLSDVSPERLCFELFRILDGPRPATSIRALDMLGGLSHLLPELLHLKGIDQTPPHIKDVWGHTMGTVRSLEKLLHVLGPEHDPEASANLMLGLAVVRLGRYRKQISAYMQSSLVIDRTLRPLLFLAALYHDVGKPQSSQKEDKTGRIRFLRHEHIGAQIAGERARKLHLSNAEISWLETVVKHHMRPTWLAHEERGPSNRAVYRFFRDTGAAGVAISLLGLADVLATYGHTLPQERWERQLDVTRTLLEAWWENHTRQIDPPVLLSGHDLMQKFDLDPGPLIGELLESVREAQSAGQVQTGDEALAFVEEYLRD
ncbi:MAG: HDIG domain-containing protein [Chloroflexota bacterium]|nr:HDIG domain-containing protein [Chloroflexota bacterium]